MRLTQIKLSGFKSFVDPTSIHLPGQLVGVVGPNGCGKSNVIDAVRWVLGESRAAALRGDSMQDVILHGSPHRKPLARAAVELIFDNSQGRAAGQWSQYAEISVRRVLQRDGESSYYINGTHVRRRDITDMFLGTGLGPRAYAIIEQGMISRVIEAKPDELRVFLEEAAGISKYKERRRETENRLADTRENLARITDIRVELAGQLEKLEAQAKVATRYNELHSDLQLKQQLLWYLRRRDAAAERERQGQDIERATNALEAENAELRSIESRAETARSAHYTAGDALNLAQAALYSANALVARHESELRHLEETRQRLESQHTERQAQLGQWREQRSQLTQALHMWAARAGGAKTRTAEAQSRLENENACLPVAEQAFRAGQEHLNEARSLLMQAESRLQLEQANLAHLERGRQALEQRRERLDNELATLAEPESGVLSGLEARLAELDEAVRATEAASQALQNEVAGIEERKAAATEALTAAQRDHAAAEAQIATLRQIQAATEDNAPLRDWFERHGLGGVAPLWQKLRIEAGWETAVEAVLRERLHALELSAIDQLEAVATDQPPSKASLFLPGNVAPEELHGFDSLFSKILDADAAVSGALRDWLGGVFVVEGVPDASALPVGAVFVNRQGHQFTHFTVSLHAPDAADTGILARQAEIETLAARHDAQSEHLKALRALERYAERSAQVCAELDQIAAETQAGDAALADCRASQERIAAEIAEARARREAAQASHVESETALAAQRRAVQQAEREAQDAIFGERECTAKIAEIDRSVTLIDREIERGEAEVARLNEELAEDPIPALRQELDGAVESRISCEKTLGEARNAVEAAAGALRELEEGRLQVEATLLELAQGGDARFHLQAT